MAWLQLGSDAAPSGYTGATPGPHAVRQVETLVLHDQRCAKDLQVRVSFPGGGSRFPVVLWSHGAKGTKDMYQPLIEHWISHGYVCIQPNHSDSRAFGPKASKMDTFRDWPDRPADIAFLLDSLDAIEARVAYQAWRARWTGRRSAWAAIPWLAPRSAIRGANHADARPRAFILLSPQGSGRESLLDTGSWKHMIRPALSITGSNDLGRTGRSWRWRLEPFLLAPPPDKYLLYIQGAHHGFGGIVGVADFPNAGPDDPEQALYVKLTTLAFWDAYLKGDPSAAAFLRANAIQSLSHGEAQLVPGGTGEDTLRRLGEKVERGGSRAGIPSAAQILSAFDRNGDGALQGDEMPPRLAPAFKRIDADSDRKVSEEELSRGLEALRR